MIFTDLSSAQARSCASWVLLALGKHPSASLLPRPVFHPGLVIMYIYIIWIYDYDMITICLGCTIVSGSKCCGKS